MARIAENAVIQDGVWYNPGEEIPDLGNWVRVHHDGAKRYYEGVSTEIDLLPTYQGDFECKIKNRVPVSLPCVPDRDGNSANRKVIVLSFIASLL